ncbi:Arm DNA-binding domain-containing protein [Kitasatospora acidiphila]|uniref:Arm DNA-binding domain-containing protein n=1 Tax=Kitasatospora acidiphila TaxID=2567942 RepID=UPI003C735C61
MRVQGREQGEAVDSWCPRPAADATHGRWTYAVALAREDGKRRTRRRGGFASRTEAALEMARVLGAEYRGEYEEREDPPQRTQDRSQPRLDQPLPPEPWPPIPTAASKASSSPARTASPCARSGASTNSANAPPNSTCRRSAFTTYATLRPAS